MTFVPGCIARSAIESGIPPDLMGTLESSAPLVVLIWIRLLNNGPDGGGGNGAPPTVDAYSAPDELSASPVIRLTPAGCPTIAMFPLVWSTIDSAPSFADASGPLLTACPPRPPYKIL